MISTWRFSIKALGYSIMGILVSFLIIVTFGIIDESLIFGFFISSITSLLYLGMLYSLSWNQGGKDKNYVQYGHMKKNIFRGFLSSLLLTVINLLLIMGFLLTKEETSINNLLNIIMRFWLSPYLNFLIYFINNGLKVYLILFIIPAPVVLGISYILGYNDISIMQRIMYTGKFENPKRDDSAAGILNKKNLNNLKKKK